MDSPSNVRNEFGKAHASGEGITVQSGVNYGTINVNQRPRSTVFPKAALDATFDAANKEHVSSCLPGTRVKVLDEIQRWIDGDNSKKLYWLNGMAGTGKSTIALTLARMYKLGEGKSISLAGTFFFSRGSGDLSSAANFAATIAIQLSEVSKDLKNLIDQAVESNLRLDSLSIQEQWHKMVVQPLSQFYQHTRSQSPRLLIIVDALDECSNDGDVNIIIRCLEALTRIKGGNCRVFLTSRPDQPIKAGMRDNASSSRENFVLHDIEKSIIDSDLGLYYRYQLSRIKTGKSLDEDLLSQNMIDHLVERSHGLFIHAATVCRFVQDGSYASVSRLRQLLESERCATAEQELDRIYTTVLEYSFVSVTSKLTDREAELAHALFKHIIGSIVVIFDVMNSEDLAELLGETLENVHITLSALHSVIDVPDDHQKPIRILHPSFREFLLDQRRCLDSTYSIVPHQAHNHLVTRCFDILMSLLRRNPLQIEHPGTSVQEVSIETINSGIPSSLQYSARYLVDHILESNTQERLAAPLLKFLEEKYIFWLEVLAWIGQLRFAISALLNLEAIFVNIQTNRSLPGRSRMFKTTKIRKPSPPKSLHVLIDDSIRFLRVHIVVIEETPLQIYASALLFSPRDSEMTMRSFKDRPGWILNETATLERWPQSSGSISLHHLSGLVCSVAVSPDCMSVLTASAVGDVYIWDRKTGAKKFKLRGNTSNLNHRGSASASFSPNGDYVACVAGPLVRVWSIRAPDAFIIWPDSDLNLMSLRSDAEIVPDDPLAGYGYQEPALAISPDSNSIAVANATRDVWVLDITLERPVKFHFQAKDTFDQLKFSADGSLLFACVENRRRSPLGSGWDIRTGCEFALAINNIPAQGPLAFSFGSTKYIAILNWVRFQFLNRVGTKRVMVIRDARKRSEEDISVFPGWQYGGSLLTATFKPDSDEPLVMTASFNGTLVLWTPHDSKHLLRVLDTGHSSVRQIVLSPDGEFALSSDSNQVNIWNIRDFTPTASQWGRIHRYLQTAREGLSWAFPTVQYYLSRLRRGIEPGNPVANGLKIDATEMSSNSGSMLVTWTADNMAVVWNTSIGKEICRFAIPQSFSDVAVSPNGTILAIRKSEGTIQLWETKTGRKGGNLKCDLDGTLHFSPGGRKLHLLPSRLSVYFASPDCHDELTGWDISEFYGILPLKIPIPHWPLPALAFSPDEEIYAVWSLSTGDVEVRTTSNHQLKCGRSISFLKRIKIRADNKLLWILVGSSDDEYRSYIWNIDKDQLIPLSGSEAVFEPTTAVFSGDGRLLAILIEDEVYLFDTTDFSLRNTLQLGFHHRDIEFSSCGTHIITNHGMAPLPGLASSISPRLFIEDSWIQEDGRKLVALPPAHSYSMLVNDHTVTLYNSSSGDLSFHDDPIFLNFEKGPKCMITQ